MARRKTALLMTVGTGIGGEVATEDLAHGILYSIDTSNPDIVIFFGSELSKKTVESVKKQYYDKFGEEFDYFDFIHLEEIDDFKVYFQAFKEKIQELDNHKIIIDYTSGTKTMTMSAAFASMLYRKNLYFVGGERKDGVVIRGTEKIISQNLYPIYDDLMIAKIKELFNTNRFEAGKILIDDLVGGSNQKKIFQKLFEIYHFFDNANYKEAFALFDEDFLEEISEIWPELANQFLNNRISLNVIQKIDFESNDKKYFKRDAFKYGSYRILASLLNNARRRSEEHKYDDAIARLYRSFELIAQIQLKIKYGLNSSNINIDSVKSRNISENFISKLENSRDEQSGTIKLALVKDYELLYELDDDLGKFFIKNKDEIMNCIIYRNKSILAHGLTSQSRQEYHEFERWVLNFSNILTDEIDEYIENTKFPEFK